MLPSQTRSGGSGAAATMNSPDPTPILASSSVRAAAPGLTATLAALAEDQPMHPTSAQGTGTDLPAQWRLTDHIRTVLAEPLARLRDPALNRFLAQLVDGSLTPGLAAHWLAHDAVYLEAAARHVAHLVTLAPRSDLLLLAKDLGATVDELAWAHAKRITIVGAADAPAGRTPLADVTARMIAVLTDSTRAAHGPEAYAVGLLAHWAMNMAFADAWRACSAVGHLDPQLAQLVEAMRARWTAADWHAHLDALGLAVNAAFHDWVRGAQLKEGEAVDRVEKVARDAVMLEEAFFAAAGEGVEVSSKEGVVEKTMAGKVLEEARASQPWMKVED
ncbi:hypothetical protein GGF32_005008 [Allomyces javanicus]|nr:hypothetical protein GGF32_005008 [Allomyces javanicus]